MSEKKEKEQRRTMQLPIYNPASQLDYINSLCKTMDFSAEKLLTFILADWILNIQRCIIESDEATAFMSFLSHVEKEQKAGFDFLRSYINEKSK